MWPQPNLNLLGFMSGTPTLTNLGTTKVDHCYGESVWYN